MYSYTGSVMEYLAGKIAVCCSLWHYPFASPQNLQTSLSLAEVPIGMYRAQAGRRARQFGCFMMGAFTLLLGMGLIRQSVSAQSGSSNSSFNVFNVASDPQFASYKAAVKRYAWRQRPDYPNDFCVLGYKTHDELKNAFVVWRQGRQIIVWFGGDQALSASTRIIRLNKDVVPTESDLHGSTYLVTKAWVNEVKTTCDHSGIVVHVPPRSIPGNH
jgi:hypothetical protein